jgi:hypothetical protein
MAMTLRFGSFFWIPCEVRPGPFSDERLARIANAESEWVGYVETSALQSPIAEGRTALKAIILDVTGGLYLAQPVGHGVNASTFLATLEKVTPLGPVAAS